MDPCDNSLWTHQINLKWLSLPVLGKHFISSNETNGPLPSGSIGSTFFQWIHLFQWSNRLHNCLLSSIESIGFQEFQNSRWFHHSGSNGWKYWFQIGSEFHPKFTSLLAFYRKFRIYNFEYITNIFNPYSKTRILHDWHTWDMDLPRYSWRQ